MKTGVIMKLTEKYAILFSSDGSFHKVPLDKNKDWQIGDIVPIPTHKKIYVNKMRSFYGIAAVFFLIITASLAGTAFYYQKTTVISIDVNPSIELYINPFNRVISVSGWNEEGTEILEGLSLKNKDYIQAMQILLEDKEFNEYINSNQYILLSVQGSAEEQKILNTIEEMTNQYLNSHAMNAVVEGCMVDHNTIENAHTHGMTGGKYMAILQLLSVDAYANLEEYAGCSVDEIRTHTQRCMQNYGNYNNERGHCGHHH